MTGEIGATGDRARRALEEEEVDLLATGALDEIVAYEPRDLVITVGAGMRLARLREVLAAQGQWLPPAEPGRVDALPGTVGGLVAAAPTGAFEALYGPLRRHLLACRVAARDGAVHRWGRPVMKNVAGYALHALQAGGRGRLGVLVEASLRTWSRPARTERRILVPAPEGGPPLDLAASLATGPAEGAPIPDGLAWSWRADGPAEGRTDLWLHGTDASVEARRRALEAWAGKRGARLERVREGDRDEPIAEPRRDRSLRRVVLRLSARPTELPAVAARVTAALPRPDSAAEAFPLAGALRCAWHRDPDSTEGEEAIGAALDAAGPAAAAVVERGGPAEHAAAAARGDPAIRAIEARLLEALGGGPPHWVADYV